LTVMQSIGLTSYCCKIRQIAEAPMKRFSGLLSPTNWIYILAHLCLLISGFALLEFQNSIAKDIGASLVAAGIAGWVILVYVLQSDKLSERIKIVLGFGFVSAF